MTFDPLLLRKLDNDIRAELAQIDLIMKDYAAFSRRYGAEMDRHLYRAVASFLTDFYLRAESIFGAIAEQLDGNAPRGRSWHKRLIASMAVEVPGVRPAVVSPELAAELAEYLVFRHLVPQAYGSSFDEKRLAEYQAQFQKTSKRFTTEIAAFCAFLVNPQRR